MKKSIKRIAASIVGTSLLIVACAIPAFATDTSYLDLTINGYTGDYSYNQQAKVDTPEWAINLDNPDGRSRVVLKASLRNSENDIRGNMEVYEGTANHAGSSSVESSYRYRIKGYREYNLDDDFVTVHGHWDLNWDWSYDINNL